MKLTLLCLILASGTAWAGGPALTGMVRDSSGHPIKGADVRIESAKGKFSKTTKSEANGRYSAEGLAIGTYKVTLVVNGAVKASMASAIKQSNKPTELNFDLKQAGKNPSNHHMVYLSEQMGTHIGGGRWVEVDENGNPVNDNPNVQTIGAAGARQMGINSGGGQAKAPGGGGN